MLSCFTGNTKQEVRLNFLREIYILYKVQVSMETLCGEIDRKTHLRMEIDRKLTIKVTILLRKGLCFNNTEKQRTDQTIVWK